MKWYFRAMAVNGYLYERKEKCKRYLPFVVEFKEESSQYRVILKKVSFGIFTIIFVSKEEKKFTIKSKDKGLSLSKFS